MYSDAVPSAVAQGPVETRPALARLDLPAVLLVLAVMELVLHRWGVRIFFPGPLARLSDAAGVLELVGRFTFYAVALVGLVTLGYLTLAVLWRGDLFRLPLRLLLLAAITWLLPAAVAAVASRGSSEVLTLHLRGSSAVVAAVMVVAIFLGRGEPRAKCGAFCLVVPIWAGLYAAAAFAAPWLAPGGDMTGWPTHAHRIGESAVVAAAVVSFLCFMPVERVRRLGGFGPLLLAVAIAMGAALLSARRFDVSVRTAAFGFGLELPLSLGLRSIYLAALFSLALTVLSLIAVGGAARARGIGLALVVLAGYQPQHALHVLLQAVGMMVLAMATLEPAPGAATATTAAPGPVVTRFGDAAWRRFVAALKLALTAAPPATAPVPAADAAPPATAPAPAGPPPEAVVVEGDEGLITRLRCEREGWAVTLRFLCREGLLRELDLAVGPTDAGPPLLSLTPRAGSRALGPTADGPAVETGDLAFDRAFKLRGRAELADAFDAPLRARLAALPGWLGVWAGGVRYHAAPTHPGALDAVVPSAAITAGDPAAAAATVAALDALLALAARTRR